MVVEKLFGDAQNARMIYPPILVVGTGRSGTSTVARILHEHFKVHMGDEFVPASNNNPRGPYEEKEINAYSAAARTGEVNGDKYVAALVVIGDKYRKRCVPWGIKDPRIADFTSIWDKVFWDARYIWCQRDRQQTINSLKRCYGQSDEYAAEFADNRTRNLQAFFSDRDHLAIDFSEQRTDEWVIEQLAPFVAST